MSPADIILRKALVASGLNTAGWSTIQAGIRNRAFFSSQVNQAKIVYAMHQNVAALVGSGKSPSEVRRDLRAYLESIGYDAGDSRGTIKDLTTKARLDVMMKTNADQAKGYASHLRATTIGAILAFPAYEFVRVQQRKLPRNWDARWMNAAKAVGFEGVSRDPSKKIALKTSPIWSQLSRFGNPFPPFDFNSGMSVRDVPKSKCREIGLLGPDEQPKIPQPPDFNGNLTAQVPMRNDDPEAKRLKDIFGDQIRFDGDTVHWQGELIQDVLSGKAKKANLGIGFDGSKLSLSHQFFIEHGGKHLDPNEPYAHLTKQEFELLPSLWRKPDRILKTRDPNRTQIELDTLDGGSIVAIVDKRNGLKSIQKRISPGGSVT
ncbi:MAG: hypothetical protein IKZ22_09205 [Kiritimatiellae bacterium]|nr:hypothetical protein [Kiritimatiellia bacterium]